MSYRCRVASREATATIGEDGLLVDGTIAVSWLDADVVREADHLVTIGQLSLTHLGAGFDRFCNELREARGRVRRPALLQATGDPLDSYVARDGDTLVDVHLFQGSLVVEPRGGGTTSVPLSSIVDVTRDGWTITIRQRVFDPVVIRGVGQRTDELLADLNGARELAGDNGWAASGQTVSGSRAEEVALLADLAGDRLRGGTWTDAGQEPMPFVLAPVGDLVAVEATDADDRATYIFRVDDVERLNAVLVLTTFRREVYSLPDDQLGRWATAVRVLEPVRWLRGALAARVIHDESWPDKIRAALTGS